MNRKDFYERNRDQNLHQEEMDRKWKIHQEEILHEQMMMFEAARAASSAAAMASGAGGGGGTSGVNPDSAQLTPFILQSWALEETQNWGLYRLRTDGSKVPVLNAPPLEGPTVFAKNTLNGFHYYVTYNMTTETANFGRWNSENGDWVFLEEGNPLLRNLVPASLQYIEGNENGGNYFIYTDNSQYISPNTDDIAPKTYRIDFPIPEEIELTELHEWEIPNEFGAFPISTFYQLPVAVGASPTQDLFQVQQYGGSFQSYPLSVLSSINGDTYERTSIDIISIDGLSIDAVKVAFVLDRTDYGGDIYFNILANDKINETQIYYIAKFNPTSENPSELTSIYQYSWDDAPYITLTTI